ncbi:hypothetical protein [Sphingomonas psychrotolerans]|uniref:Uncharacterized protein n=1 Tax=Sphingomonas psychrotolerans TaxID=1327635 RepID=A0A2K8MD85_9SPHN|nr:hypothetical protein [Sphingomonas psychrotolerans]ATY30904.1 hypothetical protein CVN68_01985 [Sphingomonas psychrotolerans]
MSGIRVDRLELRLKTPERLRDRSPQLQTLTEAEFVPAVLRAMHRRLRARYGEHAVIRIRHLRFDCRLRLDALADLRMAETIGDDLAASIAATVTREHGSGALPSPHAEAQIYVDAAHATAAGLIAAAERRTGPRGRIEPFDTLWQAVRDEAPAEVARVLARCRSAAKLAPVLARLELPALIALEKRIASAPAAVRVAIKAARIERSRTKARAGPRASEAPAETQPGPRPHDAAKAAPIANVEAEPAPEAPSAAPIEGKPPPQKLSAAQPIDRWHAPLARTEMPAADPAPRPQVAPPDREVLATPDQHVDASPAPIDAPPDPEPADEQEAIDIAIPADWCGLLYLVNISQKLDFAERLWQVGIDEGVALSAMLRVLAGGGEDPVTRVLSLTFPDAPPPLAAPPEWARDELIDGLTAAAASLVARTLDRPGLEARIAAIAAWFAADGFAGWAAACHLAVFEAMTGDPVVPGALADHFRRQGLIEVEDEVIRIVQPLEAIDLGVRLAGLDADPGWLAWLGKSLVFDFEGAA